MEQRLVTKRGSELARRATQDGVAVREVPWGPALDPRALWRLYREVAGWQPDLVHAHDSHALLLADWARRLPSRTARTPALVGTRRVDFHVRRSSAWLRAARVIAISAAVKGVLMADGVPERDISVVPSGVDPDEVRRSAACPLDIRGRLGLAAGTPLAVNVAALVGHKDHHTLVRAARAARAARPDLHWAVAGEGELRRSVEREIARANLFVDPAANDAVGTKIVVDGVESDSLEIPGGRSIKNIAINRNPYSTEFGRPAKGRIEIATRGGGLPEIVPPECLVPVGDAEALAQKVVAALDHPSPIPFPPSHSAAAMARGVLAVYRALV